MSDKVHPSNARDIDVEDIFTFHPPTGDQPERYVAIRAAGKEFAKTILANCPGCADRTVAVRKVREAVMVANASIALDPK
jgi:hypothetical protein